MCPSFLVNLSAVFPIAYLGKACEWGLFDPILDFVRRPVADSSHSDRDCHVTGEHGPITSSNHFRFTLGSEPPFGPAGVLVQVHLHVNITRDAPPTTTTTTTTEAPSSTTTIPPAAAVASLHSGEAENETRQARAPIPVTQSHFHRNRLCNRPQSGYQQPRRNDNCTGSSPSCERRRNKERYATETIVLIRGASHRRRSLSCIVQPPPQDHRTSACS